MLGLRFWFWHTHVFEAEDPAKDGPPAKRAKGKCKASDMVLMSYGERGDRGGDGVHIPNCESECFWDMGTC